MSVLIGFREHPPTPSGERKLGKEMRGCPHPYPQDAVGVRNSHRSWSAKVTRGAEEPTAFQGEIKICLCGQQAQLQFYQKVG